MNYHDHIRELYDAGMCVVPVRTDGSKRPALNEWKQYQGGRPDWYTTQGWFNQIDPARQPGVGILTGETSGRVEMAEIEGRGIDALANVRAYAEAVGQLELWQKATTGWLEQSPSGGLHWFYRTEEPTAKNTKLARRPATAEELAANPADKIKVLTETRGEGGFVVTAPTPGHAHETGLPWVRLLGGPGNMPTLSGAEVADFHRMLSILDEMPAPAKPSAPAAGVFNGANTTPQAGTFDGVSPLDDFETKTSWAEILQPAGWSLVWTDGGGTSYWRRPGKTSGQASATTGHAQERDRMYVFSTSTDLPTEEPMTKQFVYAALHHKGDMSNAASSLRRKGYGSEPRIAAPPARAALGTGTHPTDSNPAEGHTAPLWNPTEHQNVTTLPTNTTADTAANTAPAAVVPLSSAARAPQGAPSTGIFTGATPTQETATSPNNTSAAAPDSTGHHLPQAGNAGNLATVTQLQPAEERPQLALVMHTYAHSDDGNALALINHYGDRIRFNPDQNRWLCWNGTKWEWQPRGGGEARELAKDVARAMPENNSEQKKHKRYSLQAMGISNMLIQAQTDSRVTVRTEELDAHAWELNTPGGIIDLRTGHLVPSDPNKLHTRTTSCTPDPNANPAVLNKFLADTFPNNPDLRGYVQRLIGYSAVGEVLAHVLPFAFGGGGNGKGVLFETIGTVLGDYATSTPEGFLMAQQYQNHSTEIAKLSGARFVTCAEVNEGDKFDEAKVKLLTGGDRLTARFMRQDEFTFKPTHHLWLSGNYQPKVESGGASFWRRLRLLPFLHSVPEENIVDGLADMLAGQHGPAVLHWIAQGAAAYHQGGLNEPDDVKQATKDYALSVDTVARFLDDECLVGDEARGQATFIFAVTGAYQRWCSESGEKPLDGRALSNQLAKHGVLVGRDAPRSSQGRMYGNIQLINRFAPQEDEHQGAPGRIF